MCRWKAVTRHAISLRLAFGVWLVGGECGEWWVVELRFFVDVELEVGVEYEDSPRQVPPERPPAPSACCCQRHVFCIRPDTARLTASIEHLISANSSMEQK